MCVHDDFSTHPYTILSYGENRVRHKKLIHAIETGQRSTCCQIPRQAGAASLLIASSNMVSYIKLYSTIVL